MNCRACNDERETFEDFDDLGLCELCHELNYWASEEGYDEVRRCLTMLEELGSRESETVGETEIA